MTQKDVRLHHTFTAGENFIRSGLVLDATGGSFDILLPDGTPLARINVFHSPNGWANVDVIRSQTHALRVLAWDEGKRIIRTPLPPTTNLVAVEFLAPQEPK